MRGRIFEALQARMADDPSIFFVTGDMGINLVEPIEECYPERYLNVGIAEQNMIGVAAGLCNAGFRPVVYTIGNFLVHRCFEQIRDDIALHGYPVLLIGTSAGYDNAPLGPTHHVIDDWGAIRNLPGIDVYAPASVEFAASVLDRVLSANRPAYIRVAKGSATIPGSDDLVVDRPGSGSGPLLVSYGALAGECLKAQELMPELSVLILNKIHPVDMAALAPRFGAHDRAIVVEDHFGHSGLYSSLCQAVMESGVDCRIESAAPPLGFDLVVGASAATYLLRGGLDAAGILRRATAESSVREEARHGYR
jgi:transketolase